MPLFEYRCKDCQAEFEELVASAETIPTCPKCGGDNVTKLMSACAVKTDGPSTSGPDTLPPMGGGCSSGG